MNAWERGGSGEGETKRRENGGCAPSRFPAPRPRLTAGTRLLLIAGVCGVFLVPAGVTWIPGARSAAEPAENPTDGRNPTRIFPRRSGRGLPIDLARGKHVLVVVLQQFADSTGETVYVVGAMPPDQLIEAQRAMKGLDAAGLGELLKTNGLSMSRETFRGEAVYWVRRSLARPPRKRGGLVRSQRPSEGSADASAPSADRGGVRPAMGSVNPTGDASVRVFERVDGGHTSYLVTVETESRREAEEVARTIGLIIADRRKRQ